MISDFNGGGILYGVYNSSSTNVNFYHNTIVFDQTAYTGTSTTYGYYQITEADGLNVKNNIIKITRGGTGIKYGFYYSTAATVFVHDKNNVQVDGAAGTNNFGYATAVRPTITDWRNFTTRI